MSAVLWHILLQAAESMGSARFELRRIGTMVRCCVDGCVRGRVRALLCGRVRAGMFAMG